MSLRINHNIAALNGHRNMEKNDANVSKSLERLSSGLRINRASDDAAGLIISEQMRAQISGINQAIANSETAVSMVQTAEGALDEVNTLLNKMRALALHAANDGANDTNQLTADQTELDNIIDSVNRIANNTQFGTKKILDGSLSFGTANSTAISSVSMGGDYTTLLQTNVAELGFHTLNITASATQTRSVIAGGEASIITAGTIAAMAGTDEFQESFSLSILNANIDVASGTTKDQLLQQLGSLGKTIGFAATVTGLSSSGNITLTAQNYGADISLNAQFASGASGGTTLTYTETVGGDATANLYIYTGASGIGGTATTGSTQVIAFAASGDGLRLVSTGGSIIQLSTAIATGLIVGAINGSSAGATFQIGANVGQTATVQLESISASRLGVGGSGVYSNLAQLKGSSLVSGNAYEALKVIDRTIDEVTTIRGRLGAFQSNTLETTLSSLRVTNENLTFAESGIRDVDFAAESAEFTKNNILVQASTAMLAQANQLPQNVLQLLQ